MNHSTEHFLSAFATPGTPIRIGESANLEKHLSHVEERQKNMEEESMFLLCKLDNMDHQTEIMAIQVEKLQILKNQYFHTLQQRQLATDTAQTLSQEREQCSHYSKYLMNNNYGQFIDDGSISRLNLQSQISQLADETTYNYVNMNPVASTVPVTSMENSNKSQDLGINKEVSNGNLKELQHRSNIPHSSPAALPEFLSLNYSSTPQSMNQVNTVSSFPHPLSSEKRLSENQSPEHIMPKTKLIHSTTFEEAKRFNTTPLVDSSLKTFNLDDVDESNHNIGNNTHAKALPEQDDPESASVSDVRENCVSEQMEASSNNENEAAVAMYEEKREKVTETKKNNSPAKDTLSGNISETSSFVEETKRTVTDVRKITELDSEMSDGSGRKDVELQNETESFCVSEEVAKKFTFASKDELQVIEQMDSPEHVASTSALRAQESCPSPPVHSRNSILSDSEISDNNDVPLTSSAAYQSLIGAIPMSQHPKQQAHVTSGESESEDDVEKAMAMAVEASQPKVEKVLAHDIKQQLSASTNEKAAQPRKSIPSSSGNYKHKMSKATRKALGLDSDSDDELQGRSQKIARNDDDDEFDFFD